MASMTDIPSEVLSNIFQNAHASPEPLIPDIGLNPSISLWTSLPDVTMPVREDRRILSTYPFNILGVCKRWHSILLDMRPSSRSWTRLIFDVAKNETELLDAFAWSKDQKVDVIVYSSSTGPIPRDDEASAFKTIEKDRVLKILLVLRHHLDRLQSIIFDLTFTSSLPPAANFLGELNPVYIRLAKNIRLTAQMNDGPGRLNVPHDAIQRHLSLRHLEHLSLSILQFLDLFDNYSDVFQTDEEVTSRISVCLSNFAFLKDGEEDKQSLNYFISALQQTFNTTWRLTLHNLSLLPSAPSEAQTAEGKEFQITAQRLALTDTSEQFIEQFYGRTNVGAMRTDIINCNIPTICQTIGGSLHLDNIPSSYRSDISGVQSFRNILSAWRGNYLEVKSCPSFNDELLSELSNYGVETSPKYAPELIILRIHDCVDFSPTAMRQFLQSRLDKNAPLRRLTVKGRCPQLTAEDRQWFMEQETRVDWDDNME